MNKTAQMIGVSLIVATGLSIAFAHVVNVWQNRDIKTLQQQVQQLKEVAHRHN